jgi:hypothetical protein
MKTGLQLSVAALALAGTSLFASVPASAEGYGPSDGIGYSYESGGYCDSAGCPDDFWDYPIAYCPVYFDGEWYRGPFYYRYWQGDYYYWIRGDWRLDEWNGDRPDDACVGRFGPPEDYDFYVDNGFIWLDSWRLRFFEHHHHHDHDHDGDHGHDHDHHGGHGSWDHGGDHGVVWDHGGDHNPQPGGTSGTPGGSASGAPTPLGGTDRIGGANSGAGFRDHFNGSEGHHHEGSPPSPTSDTGGTGSGGHHSDVGGRSTPSPANSPPPSAPPPPPPPPPPSSGESHHDGEFHGDFGHHTQKP